MRNLSIGDLIQLAWGNEKNITGILLNIKQFSAPKLSMSYVKYSFEILELNGKNNWYDVWNGEDSPRILCKSHQKQNIA